MSEEQIKKMGDEIHAALCGNGLTSGVADFLTDLALRVAKLELASKDGAK